MRSKSHSTAKPSSIQESVSFDERDLERRYESPTYSRGNQAHHTRTQARYFDVALDDEYSADDIHYDENNFIDDEDEEVFSIKVDDVGSTSYDFDDEQDVGLQKKDSKPSRNKKSK